MKPIFIKSDLGKRTVAQLQKLVSTLGVPKESISQSGKRGGALKGDYILAIIDYQSIKETAPSIRIVKKKKGSPKKTPSPKKKGSPKKTPSPKKKSPTEKTSRKKKTTKKTKTYEPEFESIKEKPRKPPTSKKSASISLRMVSPKVSPKKASKKKSPKTKSTPKEVSPKTKKSTPKAKKSSPKTKKSKRAPKEIIGEVIVEETIAEEPLSAAEKTEYEKCASNLTTAENLNRYKKCDKENVCDVDTGNCVPNKAKYRIRKSILKKGELVIVGSEKAIASLQEKIGGIINPGQRNVAHDKEADLEVFPVIPDSEVIETAEKVKELMATDVQYDDFIRTITKDISSLIRKALPDRGVRKVNSGPKKIGREIVMVGADDFEVVIPDIKPESFKDCLKRLK